MCPQAGHFPFGNIHRRIPRIPSIHTPQSSTLTQCVSLFTFQVGKTKKKCRIQERGEGFQLLRLPYSLSVVVEIVSPSRPHPVVCASSWRSSRLYDALSLGSMLRYRLVALDWMVPSITNVSALSSGPRTAVVSKVFLFHYYFPSPTFFLLENHGVWIGG